MQDPGGASTVVAMEAAMAPATPAPGNTTHANVQRDLDFIMQASKAVSFTMGGPEEVPRLCFPERQLLTKGLCASGLAVSPKELTEAESSRFLQLVLPPSVFESINEGGKQQAVGQRLFETARQMEMQRRRHFQSESKATRYSSIWRVPRSLLSCSPRNTAAQKWFGR